MASTNPIPTLCKMWLKTEWNDFKISQTQILFTWRHCFMKNIRSFWISCQKHVSINLAWEQLKVKKVSGMKKKQMEEHFVTNWINWQKVSNMICCQRTKTASTNWRIVLEWCTSKINLLRLWVSHHLQSTTILNDSKCPRDNVDNHYWMPVPFSPSSNTALKTDRFMLFWKSLHGFRNTCWYYCL